MACLPPRDMHLVLSVGGAGRRLRHPHRAPNLACVQRRGATEHNYAARLPMVRPSHVRTRTRSADRIKNHESAAPAVPALPPAAVTQARLDSALTSRSAVMAPARLYSTPDATRLCH